MFPWNRPPRPYALPAEIGEVITVTLPGGKQAEYRLTTMSWSQGGRQLEMTLLAEDLVKERYWNEDR